MTKDVNNTKSMKPPKVRKLTNTLKSRPVKAHFGLVEVAKTYDNFHDGYEFQRPHSVKSPVGRHEHIWKTKHREDGEAYFNQSVKEMHLLQSRPHGFKHTESQRKGALRLSGNPDAHQVGRRRGTKA